MTDFPESDCEDRNDCHIEAIQEGPPFDNMETGYTDQYDDEDKNKWSPHVELILQYWQRWGNEKGEKRGQAPFLPFFEPVSILLNSRFLC